ncbi:MAG: calcium-binding protein [Alphaproteobacteria bacterium]|nr:calcium-binding protein [Alphaproteobacteria bacterium]
MANVYLNGGSAYFVAETVRAGSFGLMEEGRFTVTATVEGVAYRVEATGSGFAYVNGRLAVPAGSDSAISSLRLFDADGIERYSITNLAVGTLGFQTLVEARDHSGTFNLLLAGDDIVRIGPGHQFSIDGGPGADTLFGDGRSNRYYFDNAGDRIVEPANGGERDYAQIEYGTAGQILSFRLGAGQLRGIEGFEYLGPASVRVGGDGFANEIYGNEDRDTLLGGGGNDSLDGELGDDSLSGGAGDDTLQGWFGRDTLLGGAGHDTIAAAGGGNRIDGGSGDDFVDVTGTGADTILGGAGNDTIIGSGTGNALNSVLAGDAGNDSLVALTSRYELQGGDGRDTLMADAGAGQSTLSGGAGNDLYLLRSQVSRIFETADGGIDTVGVNLDYTLDENLEHLYQTDPHARGWQGTGNALANRITGGRAGSSRLSGDDGNDTLTGGSGRDTLDGGTGADRMIGGGGDDLYYVDDARDRVVERANQGYDTVEATLNAFTLGANLEDLNFVGEGNFRGTGNGLHNVIYGGAGADTLSGGGGDDTLVGASGADRLTGGTGADTFVILGDAPDRVTDFNRRQGDRLDIGSLLDQPSAFDDLVASGQLRWEAQGRDLAVFFGAGTATPIALLQGQATLELQASDFVL